MSGEAFGDIRLFGFQFDEAIQLMSEYQVEMVSVFSLTRLFS